MNTHHAVAIRVGAIDVVDLTHYGLDRAAAKFVAEDVDADLLLG